ncbi:hypothetical protein VP1G_00997 [Cytospora mali]|uniref:Uncharacterized protein n=1 Tax=Cytospora mali TaxID=578113 RepID=A0A194UPB6_CYTMA|nr:hypothetical protein VP1G_00997 [Valsa mali var. pyri (nom. inval.)]
MHYLRLMRPPSLDKKKNLKIVLTITTDLGDSFLSADEPIPISVWLPKWPQAGAGICLTPRKKGKTEIFWRAGMRILKLELPVPDKTLQEIKKMLSLPNPAPTIRINASHNLEDSPKAGDVPFDQKGRVLAVEAGFPNPADEEPTFEASREFALPGEGSLRVYEEIGESIDRHVWDAGVITMGLLLNMCQEGSPGQKWDKTPFLEEMLCSATPEKPLNVIELGCGVGILGLGLAAALHRRTSALWNPEEPSQSPSNILLTDLMDAEDVAARNITSEKNTRGSVPGGKPNVKTEFESLDWEDGKTGIFGPMAKARSWNLIIISDCTYNVDMLSALVGTISELHSLSKDMGQKSPKVMLATKPRHSSEKALFGLMEGDGWSILEHASQPLPVLGMEDESVEIYLFGKGSKPSRSPQESTSSNAKRRKLR